jgi:hypothetical protein
MWKCRTADIKYRISMELPCSSFDIQPADTQESPRETRGAALTGLDCSPANIGTQRVIYLIYSMNSFGVQIYFHKFIAQKS